MFRQLKNDVKAVFERDPAARTLPEVILCYPGLHALIMHRAAHYLYGRNMVLLPRIISQLSRFITGIEIHPGAKIGTGVFIDHGMGLVVGETTEIGDDVTIYQGVTLGGTGKDKGKRHPTVRDRVVVGAGARVLGPIEVGEGARIGAGSVVLQPVPPRTTVVGIPGRVVFYKGERVPSVNLDHTDLPDPVLEMISTLQHQIDGLRYQIEKSEKANYAERNEPDEQ